MNISPDASQAPISQHLSGEVIGRMQSSAVTGASNDSPEDPLHDLKKASASSSGAGGRNSKFSDSLKKPPSDLKSHSSSVDKMEAKDDGGEDDELVVESRKGDEEIEDNDDDDDEKEEDQEGVDDDLDEKARPDENASVAAAAKSEDGKPEVKKRRSRKKWKKPKDKPNRPLSAYNLFFRKERALMLGDDAEKADQEKGKKRVHRKTHGKIGFAQMARIIGAKWKTLPEEEKSEFEEVAGKEKKRYAEELSSWKDEQKQKAALERKNSKARGKDSVMAGDGDDGGGGLPSMSEKLHHEALKMQMMQGMSRGNLPFFGAESQQRQMPTIEYLRAMQDERAASSLFGGGRPTMGNNFSNTNQYPNAAEASASALLQQFQTNPGMMPPAAFAAAAGMDGSGRNDMERLQQLQMARMQMMNSAMMSGSMNMGGPMAGAMSMGQSMGGGTMGASFPQIGGSNQQSQQLELERLQQQMFFQNQMAAGMNNQMMGGNFGGLNNSNNSNSNINNAMNDMSQGGGGSNNNNRGATMRRFHNRFNNNL